MRPVGGMIFGHIGDRLGRKRALEISVLMMALPTACPGLVPGYHRIGFAAPVILVVLRLIQGLSVGGEFIGSMSFTTEIAPAKRRGLYGSWTVMSAVGGIMPRGILPRPPITSWHWL